MVHDDEEIVMIRLASLIGVTCIALAACALARRANKSPEDLPADENQKTDPNPTRLQQVRLLGQGHHARFSLN
jgi:hypothetical protein